MLLADVFVVMPFSDELRVVYDRHITSVVHGLDLTVARADDFFAASTVVSDVWNSICAAKVVVADCTGRNANVFYEIGIAHTLGKPVVLLAQDCADVPFDVRHMRVLTYTPTPEGLADLEPRLRSTIAHEAGRPRSLADMLRPSATTPARHQPVRPARAP